MPLEIQVQEKKISLHFGKYGQKGKDGNDGIDAYNEAVNLGFVGSRSQWVASLKGDKGDRGVDGTNAGGGITFTQNAPMLIWQIVHNLGYKPNITAFDSAGSECHGYDRINETINQLDIVWPYEMSGNAILS